jgi:hypothetical protein
MGGGTEMIEESSAIRQANMVDVSVEDGMQNIQHISLHENYITFIWAMDLIPLRILVCEL